mgnify:CR=1 FL=1
MLTVIDKRQRLVGSPFGMLDAVEEWLVIEVGAVNRDGRYSIQERWMSRKEVERRNAELDG